MWRGHIGLGIKSYFLTYYIITTTSITNAGSQIETCSALSERGLSMDLSALAPFLGPTLGPNPFCRCESFIMEQFKLRVSLLVAICTCVHVSGSPCIHIKTVKTT